MVINVVTLFPDFLETAVQTGILGRAIRNQVVEYRFVNPRDFAKDRHGTIDDAPYGGAAGMILMVEPLVKAIESIQEKSDHPGHPVIFLSPRGRPYKQETAQRLSREAEITLLCGRYKGIDERVRDLVISEEISLGDYILTGGEPAAAAVIDSVVRLLPDVMGDLESAETDSFGEDKMGLLDWPHYTRPEEFRGLTVPKLLLSGNHAKIEEWRKEQSRLLTEEHRPDLLPSLNHEDPDEPGL
ncbi:MAG: tRNA (guanosine(37)-N1)-methyltransferase TrmD [Candidatus Krumholzibacteria bacterium]|jgi:tRNA (guanine37-N1)-methyltransferase|nr:tRNA (guanosine(37)-N1)-methyltransferase TrmD [Candidatus Krumholzibacteria bacterium]MDP6796811.1 tRNA (guanosine(37)-N1)-methyltransferase TrmD [Candidatus Krumholzibacteria bacterium]MDP7021061.1 tRNA (guanosine(37)-N1)-methyltransferase TrmD [Candidatus Krumholzibacteria bacterium]